MRFNDLEIYNIDLHYHAGLERHDQLTLTDYLQHARISGRRIVGLTDHIQIYLGAQDAPGRRYSAGSRGLIEYYNEIQTLKKDFSDLKLLFAPELCYGFDYTSIPSEIIEISDYFLFEPPIFDRDRTAEMLELFHTMAEFRERTSKPIMVVHPLRHGILQRLVKCGTIEPWVTNLKYNKDWREYSPEQISEFMWLDIIAAGRLAAKLKIPLEVNGGTHYRILTSNNMSVLKLYTAAYGFMSELGVQLLPGSDLHGYREKIHLRNGRYVPQTVFEELDIGINDMPFVHQFIQDV